jgi:hypothetical protein
VLLRCVRPNRAHCVGPVPSTVLFPRDSRTAGRPSLLRPMPLLVTVELETLTKERLIRSIR